jgi:SAM-dependent methyltransferase
MDPRFSDPSITRFSDRADLYARWRPSYPASALDAIIADCGLNGTTLVIDVGCGTGISSRQFAARGIPVLGIEPNDVMRAEAESIAVPSGQPAPRYQKGRAEATGLADGVARVVLAAQAFHWFDAAAALREFARILQPGGWVVLMWNERDESDAFTAAFGAVIRTAPDAAAIETPRLRGGEALLRSPHYQDARRLDFRHEQELDEDGVLGRAFSASYAPREPAAAEAFAAALRQVFAAYQRGGKVRLVYQTSVYLARTAIE